MSFSQWCSLCLGLSGKKDFSRIDKFDFEPAAPSRGKKSNMAEVQRKEAKVKALHHELDYRCQESIRCVVITSLNEYMAINLVLK